jgi:hypothetical protein
VAQSCDSTRNARDSLVGLVLLGVVGANGAAHVAASRWFDAFWLCNWCVLGVALSLFTRSARLATIAWIWLLPGTLAWSVEVLSSVRFFATSYALHGLGLLGAVYALRRLGAASGVMPLALLTLACVALGSRLLPEAANVNGVFGPRRGWVSLAAIGSLYPLSLAALALGAAWLGQVSALLVARGERDGATSRPSGAWSALRIRAADRAPSPPQSA